MPFHSDFRNDICDVIANVGALAAITPYCALFDGDPSGAGTEVTEDIDSSGRKAITFDSPSNGVMANASDVDFGLAENPADVTHFAIFDAATEGNLIAWAALTGGSESIVAGNAVRFNADDLTVTVS